ncbi:MAG: PilZ domain-containing protein [Myxococcales bacterium]|nr:PilZ domain-containing protein [Myxococcales bacterium]
MAELRRHPRAPLDVAVEFTAQGSVERTPGRCRDVSLGGMFIQTAQPLPFGMSLVVHVLFPGQRAAFALPAVVRWTRAKQGMGVQFGLLGARETHAITGLTRSAGGGRAVSS